MDGERLARLAHVSAELRWIRTLVQHAQTRQEYLRLVTIAHDLEETKRILSRPPKKRKANATTTPPHEKKDKSRRR